MVIGLILALTGLAILIFRCPGIQEFMDILLI